MRKFFELIDIYGKELKFNTFGKEKYKTWIGGLFSTITYFCLVVGTFLFGSDFFYKTNPRIVSQDKIPTTSELVYPTNQNFTVSYRIEDNDGFTKSPEEAKVGYYILYKHFKRNEEKQWETVLSETIPNSKCEETTAVENPDIGQINLSDWDCIDWDLVQQIGRDKLKDKEGGSEYRPVLGGNWDENEVAYIVIRFGNISIKENKVSPTSYSKSEKSLESEFLYASINYPTFSFNADSKDTPFNVFYENFFYKLNPGLEVSHRNFFKIGKLVDDKGWIFKDEYNYFATLPSFKETEFGLVNRQANDYSERNFYKFLVYFEKKQVNFRRNYMKIQELAAIAGGFIKIIHFIFSNVSSLFGSHYRDAFFINKFYTISKNEARPLRINVRDNSSVESSATVRTANTGLNGKRKIKIGFVKYLCFRMYKRNEEFMREYNAFEQSKKEIWSKLDVDFILRHFNKFDKLKCLLLSETQIKDLEKHTLTTVQPKPETKHNHANLSKFNNA